VNLCCMRWVALWLASWASLILPNVGFAQTTPSPPSNLAATASAYNQINLSWSDNSVDEDGFKIERSSDGTNFAQMAQVWPNTTGYRNYGVWPGTTYYYRVRAYNAAGSSDYSNIPSASTPALCPTSLAAWGDNSSGQTSPPGGLTNIVAIAAGNGHALALKSDGTVIGWGDNWAGQATPPAGLTGVVAIAAGLWHSLALKGDGTVIGWGYNAYGQTGPTPGLNGVIAIAAGGYHSLALKNTGVVVGWGDATYAQRLPPAGATGVVAIAAGFLHSLALKSDGTVIGFGYNAYGQASPPSEMSGVVGIAAGAWHSLAVQSNGTVIGWGDNYYHEATASDALTNALAVAAGWFHSLALKGDGTVVGWGYNDYGQATTPSGLNGAIAVSAAGYYSLGLTAVPSAPSALYLTAVSPNQINLSWIASASARDGFTIERASDDGGNPGTWAPIATVASSIMTYSDTGLITNTTYWYRVRTYNACTNSPYSSQLTITTGPPPAPFNLTAMVTDTNQVNLSWMNNYSDVVGFKIERASDNNGSPEGWTQVAAVGSGVTAYTDTGLLPNTTYWYRVRAFNMLGNSANSNQAIASVSTGQLITVMQWNVQGHIGDPASNSTAEAQAIARIVNYNKPDVLLFNEINTQGLFPTQNEAALIDWATNNIPYLGTQPGVTFHVAVSLQSDGYNRNAAISRFRIVNPATYTDGLRGLHLFGLQLNGESLLQVYHAHLKCCSDGDSCSRKQSEAQFDANVIGAWASTNIGPYLFAGDWNEDEQNPQCTLTSSYHPITAIREGAGLLEFKPTMLDGEYRTFGTAYTTPSRRFDYVLAAINRLSPADGYVFSSMNWASNGLYTNASPENLVYDSRTASDHYSVFAKYFFPALGFVITPTNVFSSTGIPGGLFNPESRLYILSNTNTIPLLWSAARGATWLTLSPSNGILAAGASITITASINSAANNLSVGNYGDTIVWSNTATRAFLSRGVTLTILDPSSFEGWQLRYFGCTDCLQAAPDADPLGKGMSNTNQFLTGLNPTNPASAFGITSILVQGTNTTITWKTAGGRTNILQAGPGDFDQGSASYSNQFWDMSTPITIPGNGDTLTNFVDDGSWWGEFSNWPARYYRVRVAP
jgi:endonuclease/exonuclease/phosphatase family metal-dependent hydrolase